MTDQSDWTTWLAANPPPDLQELVKTWGGYHLVPSQAWQDHTQAMERWEMARMDRLIGSRTWAVAGQRQKANRTRSKPRR